MNLLGIITRPHGHKSNERCVFKNVTLCKRKSKLILRGRSAQFVSTAGTASNKDLTRLKSEGPKICTQELNVQTIRGCIRIFGTTTVSTPILLIVHVYYYRNTQQLQVNNNYRSYKHKEIFKVTKPTISVNKI